MIYKALRDLSQNYEAVSAYGSSENVLLLAGSRKVLSLHKSDPNIWHLIDELIAVNKGSYITGYLGYGIHNEYKKESNIPVCVLFVAEKVMRFNGFPKSENSKLYKLGYVGDFLNTLNKRVLQRRVATLTNWCKESDENMRLTLSYKITLPIDIDLIKIFSFPYPTNIIKAYPFIRSLYFKFSNIIEYAGISPELLINFIFPVLKVYKLSGTFLMNDYSYKYSYSKFLRSIK